jgi:acetyltransferase-like isoleucine patch superfamily enzyme
VPVLRRRKDLDPVISPHAIVQTAEVGVNTRIEEFAVVRDGAVIGRDVCIHPHVVIETGVRIGDGVEIFPGSYIGKTPKGAGATARAIRFEPRVVIGRGSSVGPNAVVFYDVEIGTDSLVGDGASIREQCRIGSNCLISRHVTINYHAVIGDRTRIMDLTHITGNCVIGNDVFISVLVSTANDNEMVQRAYVEGKTTGPTIADRASIGEGACLLPGVRIGEGAMVAAGAVVVRDVDAHSLVMGAPARHVRFLSYAVPPP